MPEPTPWRALAVGAVTTGGFLLVFGTVGTAISLGARSVTDALPWAGLAIGVALVLAGLAVLSGRHVGLRLPVVRPRAPESGLASDLLFGIGYGATSLSCTLPIFLAATGTSLTGGVLGSVLSFVAYAAGMGTVLTALALAAAFSRSGLAFAMRRLLPVVTRASGALLVLSGAYVVYYWGFFLLPGSTSRESGRGLIETGQRLSSSAGSWLSTGTGERVVEVLLATVGALLLWTLGRRLASTLRWEPDGSQSPPRSDKPSHRLPDPIVAGVPTLRPPTRDGSVSVPSAATQRSDLAGSGPA